MIGDKRNKYLEGEISTGYCRGRDTIIIFFSFQGILQAAREAFIEKFLFSLPMRCCYSSGRQQKPPKIEIVDETSPGHEYDYLRLEGKITYSIDTVYNKIKTVFDGWYVNGVYLWPKDKKLRPHVLMLERTPPVSPQISLSDESGIDTVF